MAPPPAQDDSSGSSGTEEEPGLSATGLEDEMIKATRRRREAKRKAIQHEYDERVKGIHDRIVLHEENYAAKIDKVKASQLQQLMDLLAQRGEIERHIQDVMERFERDTRQLARELEAVLEDRTHELEKDQLLLEH